MKLTKQDLIEIIKEEISKTSNEESDSLNIISLEPWRKPLGPFGSISSPAGAGILKAEYNGETYTFYTALTPDAEGVQIYDDPKFDTLRDEAFSEEQERQIIDEMTSPEWKKKTEEEDTGVPARSATPEEEAAHEEMVARYKKRMGYDEMKLTKSQLKQIIKEELNEVGYYGLGSEPFGAEKYRKKIEGFEKMLDKVPYFDPRMPKLENAIKLSVSEILLNIEDEDIKYGVEEIVSELLGTKYLPEGI